MEEVWNHGVGCMVLGDEEGAHNGELDVYQLANFRWKREEPEWLDIDSHI